MKKNTKGFTLIELLAVIVILAIIALIAVPVILNILTKSRESAAEDTAYSVLNAAELYYAEVLLDNPTEAFAETTVEFNGEQMTITPKPTESRTTITLKGTKPTDGVVTINPNGTAEIKEALVINGLSCDYRENSDDIIDCTRK